MARLIPAFMDDRTPPGEHEVFNLMASGPEDWVALHSLDLAPWNRGLRTEIDFVVIDPETGIVCVEIKSHDAIRFENDRWHPVEIKRSPFKQAADARHTFYRRLRDVAPQFRHVPVIHCCIFPRAAFDLRPNLSVQPWELIDARAFRSFRTGAELCAELRVRIVVGIQADKNLEPLNRRLSLSQIEEIVQVCVPVQRHRAIRREEIERRGQEADRILRDQQKPVLQLAALNPRLVVHGAAGTGKTLIAMEVARRAADRGGRVGLLCFNQLVGDWMRDRLTERGAVPNLLVGRAIRIMAEMAGIVIPRDPPASYWEEQLPNLLQERLTDPEFEAAALFDDLVIDEAQDLLSRPRLWECVTGFLHGGSAKGSLCLIGDFDNQVLGARQTAKDQLSAFTTSGRPTIYRLTENCRNYRIVGDTAVRLSGLAPPVYEGYRRPGGAIQNYDICFYDTEREQRDKLIQWLKEFKAQGYRPSEITVLSFVAPEHSVARSLAADGHRLRPQWQIATDAVGYCSVHAFKGLENKIIILTDVLLGDPSFHRDLFYVGMTRSCESVRILCHKDSQDTLIRWLSGKG